MRLAGVDCSRCRRPLYWEGCELLHAEPACDDWRDRKTGRIFDCIDFEKLAAVTLTRARGEWWNNGREHNVGSAPGER